jgi:hypothetical protein
MAMTNMMLALTGHKPFELTIDESKTAPQLTIIATANRGAIGKRTREIFKNLSATPRKARNLVIAMFYILNTSGSGTL